MNKVSLKTVLKMYRNENVRPHMVTVKSSFATRKEKKTFSADGSVIELKYAHPPIYSDKRIRHFDLQTLMIT